MGRYVRRRLIQMVAASLRHLLADLPDHPGGARRPGSDLSREPFFIDPQVIDAFRQRLGLDQPVPVQYVRWLGAVLSATSGSASRPAARWGDDPRALPATLELMSVSFVFAAVIAIPLGVYSAVRQYSLFDFSATTASFLGIAMPVSGRAILQLVSRSTSDGFRPQVGTRSATARSSIS